MEVEVREREGGGSEGEGGDADRQVVGGVPGIVLIARTTRHL